ncbi:potassium-transporting ATPase subunit F [Burkholderia ubonensis]
MEYNCLVLYLFFVLVQSEDFG